MSELDQLITEQRLAASTDLDRMETEAILRLMNREDARVAEAVAAEVPRIARAVEAIAVRLRAGGRLIYVGAGSSGRAALLDATECPPTFGIAPELVQCLLAGGTTAAWQTAEGAEDEADLGVRELAARAQPADAVVGIAASGRTPYTLAALLEARRIGCFTVALACNRSSPLAAAADMAIETLVGPEVILGSTRLKCGTAHKLVLNMISTTVMIRLGKVYSNLMVDMHSTNHKLQERSRRMIRLATGASAAEADAALAAADGQVKVALLMVLAGVDRARAEAALAAAQGHVRPALQQLGAQPV